MAGLQRTLKSAGALAFAVLAPLAVLAQETVEGHAEGDIEAAVQAAEHGGGGHDVVIPFFSLFNTNFVVTLGFLLFVAVLIYMKVPGQLTKMLDSRAVTIRKELDEARKLREEAQAILANYERKQKDVQEQAERIVASARTEAAAAADKAKADLKASIARRLASAQDQIASAEAAAVRDVRNRAAEIAVQVAGEVMAKQMTAAKGNAMIDDAIDTVATKLH